MLSQWDARAVWRRSPNAPGKLERALMFSPRARAEALGEELLAIAREARAALKPRSARRDRRWQIMSS